MYYRTTNESVAIVTALLYLRTHIFTLLLNYNVVFILCTINLKAQFTTVVNRLLFMNVLPSSPENRVAHAMKTLNYSFR